MTHKTKTLWITGIILLSIPFLIHAAYAGDFRVAYVIDGDTIILSDHRHVRYIGINAPEIAHDLNPAEYFGKEAMAFNRRLVAGKRVRLESDTQRYDRYGRELAYVYLEDGTFVNKLLIKEGFAHLLCIPPNVKYKAALLAAQQKAIRQQKGMWPATLASSHGPYTGNVDSMRFHRVTCRFGRKISPARRIRFSNKKDAFMKGYSPCKRCAP